MKKIIIYLLIILASGAGICFKDDILVFYNFAGTKLDAQIKNFQEIDFNNVVLEVQKKVLTPDPLHIGGVENQVVLLKSKIIEETNLQRQNYGLPPLSEKAKLDEAAFTKANDMLKNQYFEHISPTGIDPGKLVSSFGYEYIVAGENLILGNFASEKEVVENWMQSLGHRENILNIKFSEIGVAVIKGEYKGESVWMGVQEFGRPLSDCALPDNSLKNQIDLSKAELDELEIVLYERRQQIENTSPNSAVYRQMAEDYNNLVARYNLLVEEIKSIIAQYNSQVNIFNFCASEN